MSCLSRDLTGLGLRKRKRHVGAGSCSILQKKMLAKRCKAKRRRPSRSSFVLEIHVWRKWHHYLRKSAFMATAPEGNKRKQAAAAAIAPVAPEVIEHGQSCRRAHACTGSVWRSVAGQGITFVKAGQSMRLHQASHHKLQSRFSRTDVLLVLKQRCL